MKQDKPVVSHKNLSRKPPLNITAFFILGVKAFNLMDSIVGAAISGAISMLIIFLWVMYLRDVRRYNEKPVDIFNNDKTKKTNANN